MRFETPKKLVEDFENIANLVKSVFKKPGEVAIHVDSDGVTFAILDSKYVAIVHTENDGRTEVEIASISKLQQPFTFLGFAPFGEN